jgi:uncharacterized protein involved in response to NO
MMQGMEARPSNVEGRRTRSLAQICQEPFRIFFPTGIFLGLVAVSLWLFFYLGAVATYPGVAHARLMVEGFMASFIVGFLGTAGPRLTSTPHFSLVEVAALFTLDLLAAGAHTAGAHRFGDVCFLICLFLFVVILLKRFRAREDNPPPNFVLVALGVLSGIAGAALVAWSEDAQYTRAYQFGSALLNECFVLLPVLGVAPFFLGKLLDLPSSALPESRAFSRQWKYDAAINAVVALSIVASFFVETTGRAPLPAWFRAFVIALYLFWRMPWRGRTFLADYLRIGLVLVATGFFAVALWPNYRIGELHIVFITGFNLIVFTVATRVVLGHSGNLDRVKTRLWFFIFVSALLFLAMVSRVTADLSPRARIIHLLAAAVCWLAASIVWMIKVIPKVTVTEEE